MDFECNNMWELVCAAAYKYPNNIYLDPYESGLKSQTFKDLHKFSVCFSQYIDALGISSSAKIVTILPNSTLSGMLTIAIMCSSRCYVPIHPGLTVEEIKHIYSETEPELIIHSRPGGLKVDFCDDVTLLDVSDYIAFIEGIYQTETSGYVCHAKYSDLAEVVFTSGSTGTPKGVMLSHKNILTNSKSIAKRYYFNETSKLLTLVPLYHTGGQIATTIGALWTGSCVTIVPPEKALYGFWDIIETFKINWTVALTTFLSVLLFKKKPLHATSLQGILVGGSSVSRELVEAFQNNFSVMVYQIYGLTETTSISFSREADDKNIDLSSAGRAVDFCQCKIVQQGTSHIGVNKLGEIYINGDHVFMGYLNRPKLTEEKLSEGYLKTGDIGYLDEKDYLYVIDRKDNLIISGGENIYPAEIEKLAPEIPGISEFIVCSESHPLLGESLTLIYKLGENALVTDADIYIGLSEKLAKHKIPKKRINLTELGLTDWPRTNSGKICRNKIKKIVITHKKVINRNNLQ